MLELIMKDEEIKAIINNVNNVIIVNNCGCHGMGHITRVMNYVKYNFPKVWYYTFYQKCIVFYQFCIFFCLVFINSTLKCQN